MNIFVLIYIMKTCCTYFVANIWELSFKFAKKLKNPFTFVGMDYNKKGLERSNVE